MSVYVPAAASGAAEPFVAKSFSASAGDPATPNAPAWIDVPGEIHSSDVPIVSSAPSVNELTAWAIPFVRTSRPVPSSLRSVAAGNAAVAAISQMPFDVARVGPAQYCGRKKRKPELYAAPPQNVTPCGSSSECVLAAVSETWISSVTL